MVINGKSLLGYKPIREMLAQKMRDHGVSFGLAEAGYDIRLKQDITFTPKKWWQFWKFSEVKVTQNIPQEHWEYAEHFNLPLKETEISFGRFCLASAIEEFTMPADLVGVVHDKSTWARQGVSVFNTVIEPGWQGFLTLEIVFHGNKPVHIPAGAGIAQVLFHKVCEPAQYNGKYQHQADKPVESKWEK